MRAERAEEAERAERTEPETSPLGARSSSAFSAFSALSAVALLGCAPTPPETAGFVYRLGVDTTAVASVTWTGGRVEGVYVNRVPQTSVHRWHARVGSDGTVEALERTQHRSDSLVERLVMTFHNDSAVTERHRGDSVTETRSAAPRGTVPNLAASTLGLLELMTRRAVASGAEQITLHRLAPGDTAETTDTLVRAAPDSFASAGPGLSLQVDSAGRILAMGGNVERVDSLDIEAVAASFGDRPLGALSPRDSLRVTVAGATISVEYGRPKKRGRVIFGGLVPWGTVWRTGAGDATVLTTDRDLLMGRTVIPAGSYSLFTLPSSSGWQLIVSTKTGEDAATYEEARDLARVALRVDTVPDPLEQFTIAVEPAARGGVLRLAWDRTSAWVEFRRR